VQCKARRRAAGTANATLSHMASNADSTCRLCGSRVPDADLNRQLCPVCDEYAQHVALQSNQGLDRVVGELQNGIAFRAALRNGH
jgi:Zn finger protein HypA/HybF involved in hydrogenase expression